MNMDLSKDFIKRYTQEFALDEPTRIKAEALYNEFLIKSGYHSISANFANGQNLGQSLINDADHHQMHIIMRNSILIASKSTVYPTVGGTGTVRGSGLSVTQFLRGPPEIGIEDFIFNMKEFIDKIHLDSEVVDDCKNLIDEFQLALTLYNKFDEVWKKLGIKDKYLTNDLEDKVRKITWLIFITAKVRFLGNTKSLAELAYMLIASVYVVVQYLPPSLTCLVYEDLQKEHDIKVSQGLNPEQYEITPEYFHEYLTQYFKDVLKSPDGDAIIVAKDNLVDMLIKLKQRAMLQGEDNMDKRGRADSGLFTQGQDIENFQMQSAGSHLEMPYFGGNYECQLPSKCLHGIFNSENLNNNYKKLDAYYQGKISPDELDGRHFINRDIRGNMTPFKLSPFARHGAFIGQNPSISDSPFQASKHLNQGLGDTGVLEENLEPPQKRQHTGPIHSSRKLNYDQASIASSSLKDKLNEFKFPQNIPNSPYSFKQITPATPISMSMELKNWQKQTISRVVLISELDISNVVYSFIQLPTEEEKISAAKLMSSILKSNMDVIIEGLAEKEGKKGDQQTINYLKSLHGKDALLLANRILEDLLMRELHTHSNFESQQPYQTPDFSELLTREIFLKSVLICAFESIFYINIIKTLPINDTITLVQLKPFDFWRLLNSFLKIDPHMPRSLNNHFREIEIKIVTETAWINGSPVVNFIRELIKSSEASQKIQQDHHVLQPFNMFFKRLLQIAAQRVQELGEGLKLEEEVIEKIWLIIKQQLSTEPQLLINRVLDQMIMCAVYGVCKVQPQKGAPPLQFNDIIKKYSEINKNQKSITTIYFQVYIREGERKDIIIFYNEIYIKAMKEYIIAMKPGYIAPLTQTQNLVTRTPVLQKQPLQHLLTPKPNKPQISALCPPSPLRQCLPPPMMQYNQIYSSTNQMRGVHQTPLIPKTMASPLMTPRMQQLYAFGESATSELGKIGSVFQKVKQQSNGTNLKSQLMSNIMQAKQGAQPQIQQPQVLHQQIATPLSNLQQPQLMNQHSFGPTQPLVMVTQQQRQEPTVQFRQPPPMIHRPPPVVQQMPVVQMMEPQILQMPKPQSLQQPINQNSPSEAQTKLE